MNNRNFAMPSSMRRQLDGETIAKLVPSVFAEKPFGETSHKYSFIPTIRFMDQLQGEGWIPVNAREQRVMNSDRQGYQKHVVKFQHQDRLSQHGEIVPEIILTNSHDARSSFKLMGGMFRLVCSNGLVIADAMLASVTIRHSGYTDAAVKEASDYMLEGMPKLVDGLERYRKVNLDQREAEIFAASAAMIRWNKETEEELPVDPKALLQRRRVSDQDGTLWNTFNVVQENLLKGGIRMRPKPAPDNQHRAFPQRGRKIREVGSINEDIRINRALWTLTERMKQLKEEGSVVTMSK